MNDRSQALSGAHTYYSVPTDNGGRGTHLRVTQELIDQGERGNPDRCPIVLAFKQQFDLNLHLGTSEPYILKTDGSRCPLGILPEVAEWVGHYDRGEYAPPREWTVSFTEDVFQ